MSISIITSGCIGTSRNSRRIFGRNSKETRWNVALCVVKHCETQACGGIILHILNVGTATRSGRFTPWRNFPFYWGLGRRQARPGLVGYENNQTSISGYFSSEPSRYRLRYPDRWLEKQWNTWEDNIGIDLKETGCEYVNRIHPLLRTSGGWLWARWWEFIVPSERLICVQKG